MDRILSNVQLVTSLPKNIGFPDYNEIKVFLKLRASFCISKDELILKVGWPHRIIAQVNRKAVLL